MPPRTRYFHLDGPEAGITPSQLKRSSRATKRDYMIAWFESYYEDPANQTPYNSREGGYQYIHGGPYDAHEELSNEFGNLVSEELIAEVAQEIEDENGISDWAPSSNHSDMRDAVEDAMLDRDDEEHITLGSAPRQSIDERLSAIERTLHLGTKLSFGLPEERALRADILDRLKILESELAKLSPQHGGIGHNGPPEETHTPKELIYEVSDTANKIQEELVKSEPDTQSVLKQTSRFRSILGWIGTKANNFVDGFVKSSSETTGKLIVPILLADAVGVWDKITNLITVITEKATNWLELVTFFQF